GHLEPPCGRLGQTARRQRGRHRHARPPAAPRSHPEMWTEELENENRLAGSREDGVKEPSPGPHPLAGFDMIPLAAFDLTPEASDGIFKNRFQVGVMDGFGHRSFEHLLETISNIVE